MNLLLSSSFYCS